MSIRRSSSELNSARLLIRDLAAGQGGVFRRSDLIAWGFEPTIAVTMKRNGSWIRLHHGVYADRETVVAAATPQARHALLSAATLAALPAGMALFGPSASVMQNVAVDRGLLDRVHLVRPPGADCRALRRRISAIEHLPEAVIHVLDVPEHLMTVTGGLAMVSKELAACGAALLSSMEWAVATLDSSAWQDEAAIERMKEISEMWPRISGAGTLRGALPLVRSGAQTPLESISRVKLMRQGLPEPELQVRLEDENGLIGFVDMLFEGLGVVCEADGDLKYDGPDGRRALREEKAREDRIRRDGYGVVRWGWLAAMGSMRAVAGDIWRAKAYSRRQRTGQPIASAPKNWENSSKTIA